MLRRLLLTLVVAACPLAYAGDAPTNVLVLTGGVVGVSATESPVRAAGYGRELINKLMQDAGLAYTLEPQPFARALRTLETQPNAVLFPMLRTAERESRYQWIGLMAKRNYYLYRLDSRKDIVIQSLEDAKQYRVGVLRGDVRTDYLRAQGFLERPEKGLEVVNVAFSLLKMQQAGRIDLIVFSDEGVKLACEESKISCDGFTPAFRLDMAGNLWLAASPQMPPALVNTLRKAFQKQEDSGYLGKLMKSGRPVGG
jgi:polar amino acid transport system substrate-binding protein